MAYLKYIQHPDKETRIKANEEYTARMLNDRINPRTGINEATFRIETGPKDDDAKFGMADFAFLDLLDELAIDQHAIKKTTKLGVKFEINNNGWFDLTHISIV